MINKPLIAGVVGFIFGGLLVSVAATTFDKPEPVQDSVEMSQMTASLKDKSGDEYDKAFIDHMIDHHQAAVDMAKLSADRAAHQEIKDLSLTIIEAQEKEIAEMKQWQTDWGYHDETQSSATHSGH